MATILITGCSTGIGFATADVLARSGHQVYATMRNPQRSPELAQLAQRDYLPITILPMDVDSDESVKATVAEVLAQAGAIDVLVNNAGVASGGAVEELPFDLFRKDMETNYFGTVRCIQAVLPAMRERRSGCIINVTSISGKFYGQFQATYCASKAAVEAMSECLAQEVQSYGIQVAVVQPGVTETPIFTKSNEVPADTKYPNIKRLVAFFAASLENHTSPIVVGEAIRAIVDGERTGFRHPTGPDSHMLLGWRASLSDEDWVASAGIDDETWIAGMAQLGLNVRPYLEAGIQAASSNL